MRAAALLLLVACGGDQGADSAAPDLCAELDAPVTWDNFGAGFTSQYCQGCHASTVAVPDRYGAPKAVVFDTEADVLARADRVLALTVSETPTMPPGGGVPEDDRLLLEVWLRCWAE